MICRGVHQSAQVNATIPKHWRKKPNPHGYPTTLKKAIEGMDGESGREAIDAEINQNDAFYIKKLNW